VKALCSKQTTQGIIAPKCVFMLWRESSFKKLPNAPKKLRRQIQAARWINSEDMPLIPLKRSREVLRRWASENCAELLKSCACNRFEDSKRLNDYDWIAIMQYFYPQNQLKTAICEHANSMQTSGNREAAE
jgi:hypothetical protein